MKDDEPRILGRSAAQGDEEARARLLREHVRRGTFEGRSLGRLAGLGDATARALVPSASGLDPKAFGIATSECAQHKASLAQSPGGLQPGSDHARWVWEALWAVDAWLDFPCAELAEAAAGAGQAMRSARETYLPGADDMNGFFTSVEELCAGVSVVQRGDPYPGSLHSEALNSADLEEWAAWPGAPAATACPPLRDPPETLWTWLEGIPSAPDRLRAALASARLVLPLWVRSHPDDPTHRSSLLLAEQRAAAAEGASSDRVPHPDRSWKSPYREKPALGEIVGPYCAAASICAAVRAVNQGDQYGAPTLYVQGDPVKTAVCAASLVAGVERTKLAIRDALSHITGS
ncbi:MAG: hypothetical protein JKY65_18470 [Planctomycetes bacterium]|nr:hypothetical protein [Planctomycetota bacterium]